MAVNKIRRVVVIVIIAGALLSVVFSGILIQPTKETPVVEKERVVVIPLRGTIEESSGTAFTSSITPDYVSMQLERAEREENVEAVVLRVNSPGGSVAASQQIAEMVKEFEMPVVVSMADTAASGGYYISAPADGIVAHPGTMTGSIGVITMMVNPEGLYEKLGIEVETIKSGEHKDMFQRTLTEEEREIMQGISDEAYSQFLEEIAAGRDMEMDAVRELATGELFIGSQAKERGLVDELGGTDTAVDLAAEIAGLEDPVKYEFPAPTFMEFILGMDTTLPDLIKKSLIPSDFFLIEKVKQGLQPELRYQPGDSLPSGFMPNV